ncbi:DNA polymerase III subunit alpha [Paenibacillaceae bacterium]|nr:DNA polymerase III subunit alpha [Paenibacillaceae bacterium]
MNFIGLHCHTAMGSNIRLLDCINKTDALLKTAVDLGYNGLAITDHEALSSHVNAIKTVKEMKKKKEMKEDFKLILGNEIYLVDSLSEVRDNYQSGVTKFPHFILLACDLEGHDQLRQLSSIAWSQSFKTGLMERVPTEKHILAEIVSKNKGHLIATTACLGSELAIHTLELIEAEKINDTDRITEQKKKINGFMKWCIDVFGKEKFFVELQPSFSVEQKDFNKKAILIAQAYGLKTIVATDAHFLRPEHLAIHGAYLNSKQGDRETESFYASCFVQTEEEMLERLCDEHNITIEQAKEAINNTMLIGNMVEDYDLFKPVSIPRIKLPDFSVRHIFKPAYEKYEYIKKLAYSEDDQDRYLIKLIEDGFDEKVPRNTLTSESLHEKLARINLEFEELWHISQALSESMSAYYVTIQEIINIIWDDCGGNSIVGAGRGSAAGFYINYLLDITQVDPLTYNLPHWRHLHKSRPDHPDIDIDSEGGKRKQIITALKNRLGERKVINIATFGTEKSKSAVLTSCRGLGIDNDIAMNIASLIPFERGSNWSLSDCLYGNEEEDRKPVTEFINEIEKYPLLKEMALQIEGVENKRSIHAGGVFIYNEDLTARNALMKAPNGQFITQFTMGDSEYMGGIKYDLLTVEAMDKIRESMNLLLEFDQIKWKGNLRNTYKEYFHPDVLTYDDPKIWERMAKGEVLDLFQFNTQIGVETAKKVKPENILETSVANSLMRLMADGGETQPVDLYVKYKNDISKWYDELDKWNLNSEEIKLMEHHLKKIYGVADTQEVLMLIVLDSQINNFSIEEANKLRKAIAKRSKKVLEEVKQLFFEKGRENNASENLLKYIWNVQIKRQIGYSFSTLHTLVYSIIALQELNIYHNYDPLFWNTACLTVNSASGEDISGEESEEDKKNKATDYGKVASAIGNMQQHGVKIGLPNINKAHFGFKPDFETREIVYGLKGLVGIGDDAVQLIIKHRPYASFDDFIERMYNTGLIKKSQMVQLIKAGCFDSFGERVQLMKEFIFLIHERKDKLTLQNFNLIIEKKLLPPEHELYSRLFKFRKYVMTKVFKEEVKNKFYILDDRARLFFNEHFTNASIVDYVDGYPVVSEKIFKKEYDKLMNGVREWLSSEEVLISTNQKIFDDEWDKHASGTISKWEMDSLSFYYNIHELSHIDRAKYGIVNFENQPEKPVIAGRIKFRDVDKPKFKIDAIVGTVLDKDKNKHTVSLLTPDGVVNIKYYDGQFAHYNKQISSVATDGKKTTVEKSWFTRGNKLFICGYRRGSQFKPHRYKDTKFPHTTLLIEEISELGVLKVREDRVVI